MITSEDCYAIWAPDEVVWAQWAKPVMFASAPGLATDVPFAAVALDGSWLPEAGATAALVVDLPGAEPVTVGLALAARGFRPVPPFNGTDGPSAVVRVDDLMNALGAGSQVLKTLTLPPDARPAFLLDANRGDPRSNDTPGCYDNRWVVLPQDFPSATFLLSQGIQSVTLVQRGGTAPAEDLAHVLLRWQQGGLRLRSVDLGTAHVEENLVLTPPSMFRKAWYGAVALMGLRRNNVGGFGSMVPEQTAGRGGFYG